MSSSHGTPNLRNTLFDPKAKARFGLINIFFSDVVIPSKMPYFTWEGKVYKVVIPSCKCVGKATYSLTAIQYSELTN